MEIEATKDFKRPRADVLEKFRDPARFESVLSEMGASVERRGVLPEARWDCSLMWRESPRQMTVSLAETARDETMTLGLASDLAGATMVMDFYDLPDGGCRVLAKADLQANTVTAKLALQSLRLVRGRAEERLTRFVAVLGRP